MQEMKIRSLTCVRYYFMSQKVVRWPRIMDLHSAGQSVTGGKAPLTGVQAIVSSAGLAG